MSTHEINVPPGKKAIVTNNSMCDVTVYIDQSIEKDLTLKPGDSEQVFNTSSTHNLQVTVGTGETSKIVVEIVDFDDV